MRRMPKPENHNVYATRGRPLKYGELPESYAKSYSMSLDEIQFHFRYWRGEVYYCHYSLQIEDLVQLLVPRPKLVEFLRFTMDQLGIHYICFIDPETQDLLVGPYKDFSVAYEGIQTAQSSMPNNQPSQQRNSTSQPTARTNQPNIREEEVVDGSDVTYDPRFDPYTDTFQGNSEVYFDEDCMHGKFPLWRNLDTNEIAYIPKNEPMWHMNQHDINLYSEKTIKRLIGNLAGSILEGNVGKLVDESDPEMRSTRFNPADEIIAEHVTEDPDNIVPDDNDPNSEAEAIRKYLASKGKRLPPSEPA